MQKFINTFTLLAILQIGAPFQADQVIPLGNAIGQADLVATEDGYALTYRFPAAQFVEVDLNGNYLHGPTDLDLTTGLVPLLRQVPGGYTVFVSQGPVGPILTRRLNQDGVLMGDPQIIIDASDLFSPDVVSTASAGSVLVYPQWQGVTTVWSQPIGPQGGAQSERRPLHLGAFEFPETYEVSAAANKRGLHAAWRVEPGGAYYREMSPDGRPRGALIKIDANISFGGVALAATGKREFVFYGTGASFAETDVVLRISKDGSDFSPPMMISSLPGTEAQGLHPIDAVAQPCGVAVLWRHKVNHPFPEDRDWYFQELDIDGHSLGPRRNLDEEVGENIFSARLFWDSYRKQYVVAAYTDEGVLVVIDSTIN